MLGTVSTALLYLITTLFNIYLFILMIRIILAYVGANYFDPYAQFIIRSTDPIIKPLRRIIPNYRRIEYSSIVVVLGLQFIKYFLICLLTIGTPHLLGVLVLTLGDSLKLVVDTFLYAIIVQVILSWIQPHAPLTRLMNQFVAPIMQPLHRIIPPVGGLDITPIPALILLQLCNIVIISPILSYGYVLAFVPKI